MRKSLIVIALAALLLASAPLLPGAQPALATIVPTPTGTRAPTRTPKPTLTPTPYPQPHPAPDWLSVASGGLNFGAALASAGDVNGDGFDDVVVGQPADLPADLHLDGSGAAYLYYGSPVGLAPNPAWVTGGGIGDDNQYGASVRGAGDVNGDGYDDLIVGQPGYSLEGYSSEGRVHVFYGSSSGLQAKADWTALGRQSLAYFGDVVGAAGDVNGDGYDDIFVGAYGARGDAGWAQGKAYVWCGSPAGLPVAPCWTAAGDQVKGYFGAGASGGAGDVNGDGFDDALVAAPSYDSGKTDAGRAYLYYGSAAGLNAAPGWVVDGDQAGAQLGSAGGAAGDLNGDGYADFALGAPLYDARQPDAGRVLVYTGSSSGPAQAAAWSAEGERAGMLFGAALGSAGDMDGDGDAELAVGAYPYDNGQTDEGAIFVYRGSPAGPSPAPAFAVESDVAYTYFGNAVGPAGDVNGGGVGDLVVGAVQYNGNRINCGAAFAWYGEKVAPEVTQTPSPTSTATPTPTGTATTEPTRTATPSETPTRRDRATPLYLPLVILGRSQR